MKQEGTTQIPSFARFFFNHLLGGMSTTKMFHFRALVCASVHFVFCAILGITVLGLVMADVMTTSSELPPPWWITGGQSLLMILSAPTAAFFGLWDNVHWTHSMSLSVALAWSVLLGYLISFVWQIAHKVMVKRALLRSAIHTSAPVVWGSGR